MLQFRPVVTPHAFPLSSPAPAARTIAGHIIASSAEHVASDGSGNFAVPAEISSWAKVLVEPDDDLVLIRKLTPIYNSSTEEDEGALINNDSYE
jgi:hypothetical protein